MRNADDARFCNQCGVRIDSMAPVQGSAEASALPGVATNHGGKVAPASAPVTVVAAQAAAAAPAPAWPPPDVADEALRTGERIELPMTGPSRRTLVTMFLGVGLGCAALGGLVAVRTFRAPASVTEPVTAVGLIGEPSMVDPVDAGALAAPAPSSSRGAPSTGPGRTPGTVARNAAPARPGPSGPSATPPPAGPAEGPSPGAPSASPSTPPAGTTTAAAGPSPVPGAAPGAASTPNAAPASPTAPGGAAEPLPAPSEGGLIERGPRTTRGGVTEGEETDATGRMDPTAFTYVYRHYSPQISACYSSASRNREVNGVVVMRVRIGEDGRVRRTRVVSDTVRVPELVECLHNRVRAWRYPQPEGGDVEVDYPMRFGSAR